MKLEMTYGQILDVLEKEKLLISAFNLNDATVNYISHDSRDILDNTLFFCKGKNYKKEYLLDAINKGCTVYISEAQYDTSISHFIVTDIRRAMATIASEFYKHSFNDLETIGITGTKGKTTVLYFLKNILDEYAKSKTAVISTIEIYTGKTEQESHLTTPEPIDLHKYFYETVNSNIKYLTMEVTSQAYKIDRVYGVEFKHGMFLNISEDHISESEHPNFEDYFKCKLELLKHCQDLVINKDMDKFNIVIDSCKDKKVVLYGSDNQADYYYTNVKKEDRGFSFDVINEKLKYTSNFKINMQGRFNIENAVAAITMSKVMGIDDISIAKGLIKTEIKGRMNVYEKDGITVVVDFAHNGLSFSKLYESLKLDYPNRRIISVGGAPGNKAYQRRKEFAEIIGDNSDYIYLTADDPQFEEVKDICNDIISYIKLGVRYEVIEDRTQAIEKAISNAQKGDVIVLLAKGEEPYLKINNECVPYESDTLIAKRMLGI